MIGKLTITEARELYITSRQTQCATRELEELGVVMQNVLYELFRKSGEKKQSEKETLKLVFLVSLNKGVSVIC